MECKIPTDFENVYLVQESVKLNETADMIRRVKELMDLDTLDLPEIKPELHIIDVIPPHKERIISDIPVMDRYVAKYMLKDFYSHVRYHLGFLDRLLYESERRKREEYDPYRSYGLSFIPLGPMNQNGRSYSIPYNVMSREALAKLMIPIR